MGDANKGGHHVQHKRHHFDMRRILDNTLMQQQPALAVTLVENNDPQPLQSLESPVDSWFKPLASAIIMLRQEGYPCVLHVDYYGADFCGLGENSPGKISVDNH